MLYVKPLCIHVLIFKGFLKMTAYQTFHCSRQNDEISRILIDEKEWTFIVRSIDIQEFKRLGVNENSTFSITIQGRIIISYALYDQCFEVYNICLRKTLTFF